MRPSFPLVIPKRPNITDHLLLTSTPLILLILIFEVFQTPLISDILGAPSKPLLLGLLALAFAYCIVRKVFQMWSFFLFSKKFEGSKFILEP